MEDVIEWLSERVAYIVGGICVIGIGLLVVLLPLSLKKVNFDEVGLKYNKLTCKVDETQLLQEGLHNVGPSGKILSYLTTQRSANFTDLLVLTSDGLRNSLTITVAHSIIATLDSLLAVQRLYGDQDAYDAYIADRAEYVIRNTASRFTAAQFFAERQSFQTALFADLSAAFNTSSIYSSLELVQVVNIDLPNDVEAVLNDVTTSEQDIQNAEAERALQVRQAEINVTLARSNANIALLGAERQVTAIALQNEQDVAAVRVRYQERNAIFGNASASLGVVGDDFVRAYVLPLVLTSGVSRGIVNV